MSKFLVTGGNGFIASHTIEALKERGHSVITTVRSSKHKDYLKDVEVYNIDNRDVAGMRALVEKVDGVINLAGILGTKIKALTDLRPFIDNNIQGSLSVIEACIATKVPLVQIAVGNYFEHNWYSITKTMVEGVALAGAKYLDGKINVVRGLNAYGERQKYINTGKICSTFAVKLLRNEPISVYGGKEDCSLMDMIYVKDLANILAEVLENGIKNNSYGNVFEAGTGEGYSVYDLAVKMKEISGSSSEILEVPMRAGESKNSVVVAKHPYPYQFTDMDEALRATIEYYRNNLDNLE